MFDRFKEVFQNLIDIVQGNAWLSDNRIAALIAVTVYVGWLAFRTFKRMKIKSEIHNEKYKDHMKILVCDFKGGSIPFLSDLPLPILNSAKTNISELQELCLTAISHSTQNYLKETQVKAFGYYKSLGWKNADNTHLDKRIIRKAQNLGHKLGVDHVVIGRAFKGPIYSLAIIPVEGDTGQYKTVSLTTEKEKNESLFNQIAEAVAYYIASFQPMATSGNFLSEEAAQTIVGKLSPFLLNPDIQLPESQRADVVKTYEFAAESVVKCYYFPTKEALDNYLLYCEREVQADRASNPLKTLYARALLHAHENKNDMAKVDRAIEMLESTPQDADGKYEDVVEYFLTTIASNIFFPDEHFWKEQETCRFYYLRGMTKAADANAYSLLLFGRNCNLMGQNPCSLEDKKIAYDMALSHCQRAAQIFPSSEPVLASLALECYGNTAYRYIPILSGREQEDVFQTCLDMVDSCTFKDFPSGRVRYYFYMAQSLIMFYHAQFSDEHKKWEKCRYQYAKARCVATCYIYCPRDRGPALQARGLSAACEDPSQREKAIQDLKTAIEITEGIDGRMYMGGRGNLVNTRYMGLKEDWQGDDRDVDAIIENLHIGLLDLQALISNSILRSNLPHHRNYFEQRHSYYDLQAKILGDTGARNKDFAESHMRIVFSILMASALDTLIKGGVRDEKYQKRAVISLNLLNQIFEQDESLREMRIAVPEFIRPTMEFLDDHLPDWRKDVLGPSYHYDDTLPETPSPASTPCAVIDTSNIKIERGEW